MGRNFERWWQGYYVPNDFSAAMNTAMKELASTAWNAAISDAAQVAEYEADKDVAQSISNLKAI